MMAAGGLISALGFALAAGSPRVAFIIPAYGTLSLGIYQVAGLLGLGLGAAFLVVVAPPVFRRLSLLVSLPFPRVGPDALPKFSAGLLVEGLLWSAGAWILLGASLLEVAHALRPMGRSESMALVPMVTAGVALATVAGFVIAVLPGGLGVREGVLMYVLAPAIGEDLAVVAALALRLVWVVAELLAAAVLLPLGPWYRLHRGLNRSREAGSSPP
jgi:uncharacterized membrane protein YbhN (UPF0104 family)